MQLKKKKENLRVFIVNIYKREYPHKNKIVPDSFNKCIQFKIIIPTFLKTKLHYFCLNEIQGKISKIPFLCKVFFVKGFW